MHELTEQTDSAVVERYQGWTAPTLGVEEPVAEVTAGDGEPKAAPQEMDEYFAQALAMSFRE